LEPPGRSLAEGEGDMGSLNPFDDCLRLAREATPATLGATQDRLYSALADLACTQAEVRQV
jgi:hypothetical protein